MSAEDEAVVAAMEKWVPLESNPDVMNEFAHALGVPREWGFSDCFGLDAEMLALCPQPVRALVLIYPWAGRAAEAQRDAAQAAKHAPDAPGVFYMQQLVHNACGTVAVVHALGNNRDIAGSGALGRFLDAAAPLPTPRARGVALARSAEIAAAHSTHAQLGQTDARRYEEVDYHYVAFVHVQGVLYELDGARASVCPVAHGPTTPETFLQDAARAIQTEFVEKMPGIGFGVLTLGPASA